MALPPREVIQQVADANDIVDVIGEYLELQRAGAEFKALSPFTNEKTPSFYVNPAKQFFHCFSSNQGGDVFKFVQDYENISFTEALKKLAARVGIQVEDVEMTPEMEAKERLRSEVKEIHRRIRDWFHRLLLRSPAAAPAREYLKSRGIGIEVAKGWKLGYAPERSRVTEDWCREAGFSQKALLESGILRPSKRGGGAYAHFMHRLMFPINNDYGDPIAFSGRVLSKDQKGGKYVNSPETIIFHKSDGFFGIDRAKRPIISANQAILCEGQMDVIAVFEAGFENVVAALGTAFGESQANLLRRHAKKEVVICFDADRAGIKATDEAFEQLARAGIAVRVARIPAGEDPDSMIKAQGAEAFRKVIDEAEDYFDFKLAAALPGNPLAASVADRANVGKQLAAKLGLISDVMQRDLLIGRMATKLGVGEEELKRGSEAAARSEFFKSKREGEASKTEKLALFPESKVLLDLCRALATSLEAREWIKTNADREMLNDVPGSELVGYLWDGDFDPDEPATFSAFLATLPEAAQNAASRVALIEGPEVNAATAEHCWLSLESELVSRLIAAQEARMKDVSLTKEEQDSAWKEWLDLQERLKNIPSIAVA